MVSDSAPLREDSHTFQSYTEQFERVFPYYLSLGMTYEQFWEMDCTLVIHYRRAEELRNKRVNQELWLQGMYVYEALCDVSPILRAFSKAKKPLPYPAEPYPLTVKEKMSRDELKAKRQSLVGKGYMGAFMRKFNESLKARKQDAERE